MKNSHDLDELLIEAGSFPEALRAVYDAYRDGHRAGSLTSICRKAGIASKGYLSEVLSGKKPLNPKFVEGLLEALAVTGIKAEYLRVLLELERCEDEAARKPLEERRERLRNSIRFKMQALPGDFQSFFFAFEVFCAFGLYGNAPTEKDLMRYFGIERRFEVKDALVALARLGLVAKGDERYTMLTDKVLFDKSETGISHTEFLALSIQAAEKNVAKWYGDKSVAHFESSIISVNRAAYAKALARFRAALLEAQTDMESSEADLLVRFNVQVFPV